MGMRGGFQQSEQTRAGRNRSVRPFPALEPAGEGLIVEAVELGELRPAQAAGIVGIQHCRALFGSEADPAAPVGFEDDVVRFSHSVPDYDRYAPTGHKYQTVL